MRLSSRQVHGLFHGGIAGLGATASECEGARALCASGGTGPDVVEACRLYHAECMGSSAASLQEQIAQGGGAEQYVEPVAVSLAVAPEEPPLPFLYLAQDCAMEGGGVPPPECSYQNGARLAANIAIIENWRREKARNRCLYENQLNAGHPAALRDCNATELQPVPVPPAVGIMEQAIRMGGSIVPPRVAPGHYTGSGTVVSGIPTTQAPVYEPKQEVIPARASQPGYATPQPPEQTTYEVLSETPPASIYEQLGSGFEEVTAGATEATGLSRNALLLIAALVGGYLLLK